jgi:NodT family efflux transporter outer membrane factor (OMF) lipoprotein
MNHRTSAIALACTALAIALAGCSTPRAKSSVELPAAFVSAASTQAEEPDIAWWDGFGDPVLSSLVRRAASENRDVKMALERVRAARAGETISRSALLPAVGVSAMGQYSDTGRGDAFKSQSPDVRRGGAGLDVSWEVDITGRVRAGAAAAKAEASAAEYGARGVRLLVVSDVATNYFTLVGAQQQLVTVRAIAAAHAETLRLVQARQRAGLATPFDVERAQTASLQADAAVPPLETLVAVSRHRIAVLTGDQAANAAKIEPWTGDVVVPPARAGQPASLLERRPDLLALQAQLEASNFRRQQAAAEWFPRLFLSAIFGRDSMELNHVDIGASRFTNASALLAMPLFNAGRTKAINEVAEANQREALARYEDGIVRALEDVENSLVALKDERQRADSLRMAAASADSALGRAQSLYERGQIDLLPLLDAQRTRLAVRLSANDSQTQLQLASVRLFKSLGGGWQAFETQTASH